MSFKIALIAPIRQYWNQKQILYKVLSNYMDTSFHFSVKLMRSSGKEGSLFLQFFGTIYKGQLDCVNVIQFIKLLQLMDTFCALRI